MSGTSGCPISAAPKVLLGTFTNLGRFQYVALQLDALKKAKSLYAIEHALANLPGPYIVGL